MSEQLERDDSLSPGPNEQDVAALINKMQKQLVFLEKKIDILISQSQERPSGERHFSKPFRSFDRSYRPGQYHDKRGPGEDSRERGFHSGRHFEKRPPDENRGFAGPKREYSDDRKNGPGQDRNFKKKYGGEKRGFDPGKKPSFHKRKER